MNDRAIDAIIEIFVWVGFGGAVVFGLLALIARIADGSWVASQIIVSDDADGRVARWFGHAGRVGSARLTPDQEAALAGRESADAFVRLGRDDRMRLTRRSPLVRLLGWLAVGFVALGVIASATSLALLFAR